MQIKEYSLLRGCVEPLLKQPKPKVKQKNVQEIFLALGHCFKYMGILGFLCTVMGFVVIREYLNDSFT